MKTEQNEQRDRVAEIVKELCQLATRESALRAELAKMSKDLPDCRAVAS